MAADVRLTVTDEVRDGKRKYSTVICQAVGCDAEIDAVRSTRKYCSASCRMRMHRRNVVPAENIPSAFVGNSAIMIAHVAKLYVHPKQLVADVSFNTGKFWAKTDTSRFVLLKSDLYPQSDDTLRMDFRKLCYSDESIDHVVLDPPFIHHPRSR